MAPEDGTGGGGGGGDATGGADKAGGADKTADTTKTNTDGGQPAGGDKQPSGDEGKGTSKTGSDDVGGDGGMLLKGSKKPEGDKGAEGKADEKKEGEADKKDDGKAETKAPEAYEFKMPEGVELDTKAVEAMSPALKELDLTNDQAQKLVDGYTKLRQDEAKAADENWTTIQADWIKQAKTDKAFGGANFDATVRYGNEAIDKFGDDELVAALAMSGMGNHPALIRFAAKVGKAMGEEATIQPGNAGSATGDSTPESRLYPTTPTTRQR